MLGEHAHDAARGHVEPCTSVVAGLESRDRAVVDIQCRHRRAFGGETVVERDDDVELNRLRDVRTALRSGAGSAALAVRTLGRWVGLGRGRFGGRVHRLGGTITAAECEVGDRDQHDEQSDDVSCLHAVSLLRSPSVRR